MLTLADVFEFADSKGDDENAKEEVTVPEEPILVDLKHPDLRFTPSDIAARVRIAANEIYQVFRRHLESSNTLSVVQRAIAVVMPNGAEILLTTLAVSGLSMISVPMYPTLSAYEFKRAMKATNTGLLIVAQEGNPGAEKAASELDIPCAFFKWSHDTSPPTPLIGLPSHTCPAPQADCLMIAPKEYEICVKFQTAGYTACPKLACLSHRNIVLSLANMQKTYKWQSIDNKGTDADVSYAICPFMHPHGWIASCLGPLAAHTRVVIPPHGFQSSLFWQHLVDYGITWFTVTPSILNEILKSAQTSSDVDAVRKNHRLRFVRVSSQMLSAEKEKEVRDLFNVPVVQAYALTEASHQITSNGYPDLVQDSRPGSVGKPTGTEVCILDSDKACCAVGEVGEIWIRGHTVVDYYENLPDELQKALFTQHNTINWSAPRKPAFCSAAFDLSMGYRRSASSLDQQSIFPTELCPADVNLLSPRHSSPSLMRAGSTSDPYQSDSEFPHRTEPIVSPLLPQNLWLRTGDTGKLDEDGYLYIIGRTNDIINRAGRKVSPEEVEAVFNDFPGIVESAAFAVKDDLDGEAVHIAVIMDGTIELTVVLKESFLSRCTERLAAYKVPSEIHAVLALPKDPQGRLHRDQLSKSFSV